MAISFYTLVCRVTLSAPSVLAVEIDEHPAAVSEWQVGDGEPGGFVSSQAATGQ
jgi:hypothetical protein